MVADKIRALLKMRKLTSKGLSEYLGLPRTQALNTKYLRQSFRWNELIQIAQFTDTRLVFVDAKTGEELIELSPSDLDDPS